MLFDRRTDWRQIGEAISPSGLSLFLSLALAAMIVLVHIVAISFNNQNAINSALSGDWVYILNNYAISPVDKALQTNLLLTIGTAAIWSVIGMAVYGLINIIIRSFNDWRDNASDVIYTSPLKPLIRHPNEKSIIFHLAWRFILGVGFVAVFVVLRPLYRFLINKDNDFNTAHSNWHTLINFTICVAIWALLIHLFVVFIRLYSLRTRLFNDDRVYKSANHR